MILCVIAMSYVPRVVLSGGVSGGHTFPLIAVARALKAEYPEGIEFLFIGPKGRFERESMLAESIPAKFVLTGKLRRYFSIWNFVDAVKLPLGLIQALWHLFVFMPDAVFSKGGSASLPVVFVAWLYRIPIMIHDSDAVAGRANRLLSRYATRIAIAYPSARKFFPADKTALTGNPVREEILAGDAKRGAEHFGLALDKPTMLVFGGSQGATVLNEATLRILPKLLAEGIQVLHQTGHENYETIVKLSAENGLDVAGSGYVARDFLSATDLADTLALATVVLSRAGASNIAELAATKKATILVPLASAANNEQLMNALDVAQVGGAVIVEEPNLGEHILLERVLELVKDESLRMEMGEKFHRFYHPDAAPTIATGMKTLISRY